MRRALVIVAAVLALGTSASAGDYLIVAGGPREQQRLGPYRYGEDPSYGAAVRALGAPTSRSVHGSSCTARWARLGLSIAFEAAAAAPCDATALWAGATVRAGRWRTSAGLRVGDTLAALRRLYPHARRSSPSRWLLVYRRGEVGVTVYLEADVSAGRVVALRLPLPLASVRR